MQDKLEDIARKYGVYYGEVFDKYILLEHRIIKREYGLIGYLFVNREKYVVPITNILNRYYRRNKKSERNNN